jgi:hypothetical protein
MRKQDRIAREQQNRAGQQTEPLTPRPEPGKREQAKGAEDQTSKPPRETGKLPLPD